jgi:hypothetical protein
VTKDPRVYLASTSAASGPLRRATCRRSAPPSPPSFRRSSNLSENSPVTTRTGRPDRRPPAELQSPRSKTSASASRCRSVSPVVVDRCRHNGTPQRPLPSLAVKLSARPRINPTARGVFQRNQRISEQLAERQNGLPRARAREATSSRTTRVSTTAECLSRQSSLPCRLVHPEMPRETVRTLTLLSVSRNICFPEHQAVSSTRT